MVDGAAATSAPTTTIEPVATGASGTTAAPDAVVVRSTAE